MIKRTKIICTIGPATESYASLKKLYKAGMNVARLNMSHSDHKNAKKIIDRIRKLNKQVKNPVGILLDTQGPEIRTGDTLRSCQSRTRSISFFHCQRRDRRRDHFHQSAL